MIDGDGFAHLLESGELLDDHAPDDILDDHAPDDALR